MIIIILNGCTRGSGFTRIMTSNRDANGERDSIIRADAKNRTKYNNVSVFDCVISLSKCWPSFLYDLMPISVISRCVPVSFFLQLVARISDKGAHIWMWARFLSSRISSADGISSFGSLLYQGCR
jgi:hypothetical protein